MRTSWVDRVLRALAALIVRGPEAPFILGDLDEELGRDRLAGASVWVGRRRYFGNAARSAAALTLARVGALGRRVPVSILDVKLAFRMLAKHPGLTLVAVFALTLGIPASLYPFHMLSILDAPMPFDDGERIVGLRQSYVDRMDEAPGTIHQYSVWRESLEGVSELGAARSARLNVGADEGGVAPRQGAYMSASSFDLLRVPPLLGRTLQPADEILGAPNVVVLGFELWHSVFEGDPEVVGRTLRIAGVPHDVVGVMPEGFRFPSNDDLWLPFRDEVSTWTVGEGPRLLVYGRLAGDVARERLLAEMRVLDQALAEAHPEAYGGVRSEVVPYPYLQAGNPAQMKWLLLPFQVLALVLLAVACGNVGTLVLARMAARSDEVTVRTALGASRVRIVSQVFVESLVLALLATGLGLLLAEAAARAFTRSTAGWADITFWMDFGLRRSTVLLGLGLAVFCAVFAGVLPALKATGKGIQRNLQRSSGGAGVRFGRATTGLLVAEVTLGVVCLFAAAVSWQYVPPPAASAVGVPLDRFLSSRLVADASVDASHPRSVETVALGDRVAALQAEVKRRLEAEPDVRGVAIADLLPGQDHPAPLWEVEGVATPGTASEARAMRARVDVGFFQALGRPVRAGRGFTASDLPAADGESSEVVVVNTAFVERRLQGRDPVGQRIRMLSSSNDESGPWLRIVGVVGSLGMISEGMPDDAGIYLPLAPGALHPIRLAVRIDGEPAAFSPRLRRIVAEVDPTVLVEDPIPLDEAVSLDRTLMRWAILGIGAVAVIALVLSIAGLYALMSFTVSQRTREIGVRTALGADVGAIMSVVVRRALFQLGAGVAIAAFGSVILLTVVTPADRSEWLAQLVGACVTVFVIGLGACVVPTLRGLRIRPVEALRSG